MQGSSRATHSLGAGVSGTKMSSSEVLSLLILVVVASASPRGQNTGEEAADAKELVHARGPGKEFLRPNYKEGQKGEESRLTFSNSLPF